MANMPNLLSCKLTDTKNKNFENKKAPILYRMGAEALMAAVIFFGSAL